MKYFSFNNIAYTLLIGIVVISIYKLRTVKQDYQGYDSKVMLNDEVYKKIIGGMIVGEGKQISIEKFVSLNDRIDTVNMEKAISRNSLLLYYNEINCMVCIEEGLKWLEAKSNESDRFNYQIVARYENIRDAIVFKKANKISRQIFKPLINEGEKSVFMDDSFIAVVDENYELHHVFFLDTESKEKLENYFDLILLSKYLK
jgi:hypothetical protein